MQKDLQDTVIMDVQNYMKKSWIGIGLLYCHILITAIWSFCQLLTGSIDKVSLPFNFPVIFIVYCLLLWITGYFSLKAISKGFEEDLFAGFLPTLPMYTAPGVGLFFILFHLVFLLVSASKATPTTSVKKAHMPMVLIYLLQLGVQALCITYIILE